jgi:arylamine N-acetyltransferase
VQAFDRYLGVLAVPARPPSVAALSELTSAHLSRIPFENISKLYYRDDTSRRGLPDLTRFLDGIERHRFGGTCYSNNFHFHELLTFLGYPVTLCGADMSAPDVHLVNIVTLEGSPYLVDVGYGAPLHAPLPLDAAVDQQVRWGPFCYVLRPRDVHGRSRLEMHLDGAPVHGYSVTPTPRRIEEFAGVIADSFTERATFMHALLIARFGGKRPAMLRNLALHTQEDGRWHLHAVPGLEALPEVVAREFDMPPEIVRQATNGLQLTQEP